MADAIDSLVRRLELTVKRQTESLKQSAEQLAAAKAMQVKVK